MSVAAADPAASACALQVLHPGDLGIADRGERLETLLGSCIAIILTDPRRTVGAMCHIVHSGVVRAADMRDNAHAEPALRAMFAMLRARGINPALCDGYVYGGGNMFPAMFKHRHVGQVNIDWALGTLAQIGIRVIGHDVGGTVYRRLSWTVGPDAPRVEAVEV